MTFLLIVDTLLALGFTLRLVRLVITDDVGLWFFQQPIDRWKVRHGITDDGESRSLWLGRLLSGTTCPFCIGFWIAAAVVLSLVLCGMGGESDAINAWRFVAGVFTLNWLAAHIGVRAGDTGYADEE